jgi:hypothetical protein
VIERLHRQSFSLRVVYFQRGILLVGLRLRLCEANARFKSGDHLCGISARMALPWRAIFRSRYQWKVKASFGGEETKVGWQDANNGRGIAVYTDLLPDDLWVCVVVVPPKSQQRCQYHTKSLLP